MGSKEDNGSFLLSFRVVVHFLMPHSVILEQHFIALVSVMLCILLRVMKEMFCLSKNFSYFSPCLFEYFLTTKTIIKQLHNNKQLCLFLQHCLFFSQELLI